jgi:hypothetical protein
MIQFGFGISFEELYHRNGLIKLDAAFIRELKNADVELHNRLVTARVNHSALADKDHSQLLLDLAPHVEDFIGTLFSIEKEIQALAEKHHLWAPLYACKRLFVQRRAAKALKLEEAVFAKVVMGWLEKEEEHKALLEMAARYAAWALLTTAGRKRHGKGILFKQPGKPDLNNLVPVETEERDGVQVLRLSASHYRYRDGFKLTDDAGPLANALDHAHYCIFCHNQGKDSCSKGLKEKNGEFKKNALDIMQAGCPLEEKISEMNTLKSPCAQAQDTVCATIV